MEKKIKTFLEEGKWNEAIEFVAKSNINLTAEDIKLITDFVSKAVEQMGKELQSLDEVRKIIINGLVTLGQSTCDNAKPVIEALKKELDGIAEEKREIRKERRFWKSFFICCGLGLLGGGLAYKTLGNKSEDKKTA